MSTSGVINIGGTTPEMIGATNLVNGVGGSVPAPLIGDEAKALLGDGSWGEISGSDVIQTAATTGTTLVTAWNTVVLIPTLTGNIIIAYPTAVGNIGKTLKLIQVGVPNAFTITHAPVGGQTISSANSLEELNTANGSVILEAVSATSIRQVAVSVDPTTQALTWGQNYWAATGSMTNAVVSFPFVATSTRQTLAPTAQRIPLGVGTFTGSGITRDTVNNRLVIETTGRYSISADMITATATIAEHGVQLIKNGTTILTMNTRLDGTSAGYMGANLAWEGDLVATDYLELRGWVQSGTATFYVDGGTFIVSQLPTAVAPVVNTVAEYGEQVLTPTTIGAATVDITGGSFTLPSAGTWEVEYFGNISLNAGNIVGGLLIADISNVEVANSRSVTGAGGSGGGNESAMVSNKVRIITSTPTTYKIRGIGNAANVSLSAGLAMGGAGNKVTWTKIAGQLPSTGTTVDYVSAKLTTNPSVAPSTAIPFVTQLGNIPNASGIFTLTAGKTYRLTALLAYSGAEGGSTGFVFGWRNITNNVQIGAEGVIYSENLNANGSPTLVAEAMITPATDIQVRLEHTAVAARTFVGAGGNGQSSASIVQLGSTSNTVGTLPAVDQSSAGYFDIGNMRMQWGNQPAGAAAYRTVTLPAPFADSNYVVTGSYNEGGAAVRDFVQGSRTTTNFQGALMNSLNNYGTEGFAWFCVGSKP